MMLPPNHLDPHPRQFRRSVERSTSSPFPSAQPLLTLAGFEVNANPLGLADPLPAAPSSPLRPVIIIDDEPDDLFLLRRLLEKGGVKNPVITFLDSEDVRTFFAASAVMQKKVPEYAPCALFTDLKMPKIDGFELLEWLRKQKAFDDLTIVMMSSSDLPADVERAQKLGADHYLLKYPGPDRLAEVIAAAASDFGPAFGSAER
jgi:CheY-like chemotaxis protein